MYKYPVSTKKLLLLLCLTSMHIAEALPSSWTVKVVNLTDKRITIDIHSSQKYVSAGLTSKECGFTDEQIAPKGSKDFKYTTVSSICKYPCTKSVNLTSPVKLSAKNPLTSCSNIIVTVSQDQDDKWKIEYLDWTDDAAKLVEERKTMPLKVRQIFDQMGDSLIETISVFRKPIKAGVNELMTIMAKNEIKKLSYDDLYHTGFIIECQGKIIQLERNATVSNTFIKASDIKNLETRTITLPNPTTYKDFIINGMGTDPNFWKYNPITNNCQLFVLQCLKKNGVIIADALQKFIYQDAGQVLSKNPALKKFAENVTSLANRIDNIVEKVQAPKR